MLLRVLILGVLTLGSVNSPIFVESASAQAFRTKEGDTMLAVIHRVPAANRSQYEDWMQRVWWPAAQKVASKYPEWKPVYAQRRRFVPTEAGPDSMLTYLFLYPNFQIKNTPKPKHSSVGAALEASGMPEADIEKNLQRFQALRVKTEQVTLVQHEYR